MEYRIKAYQNNVFRVEQKTIKTKGVWFWKKKVEVYQPCYDISKRPIHFKHSLFIPVLPLYRNLYAAILAVYKQQPKSGCSFVKTERNGNVTYYYYEINK